MQNDETTGMKSIPVRNFAVVTAMGSAGGEPTFKTFGETTVAEFNMAVSKSYKKNGEWVDDTSWFTIKGFNATANRMKDFVRKGSVVTVTGDLSVNQYANASGAIVRNTVITAQTINVTGRVPVPSDEMPSSASPTSYEPPPESRHEGTPYGGNMSDDLPF